MSAIFVVTMLWLWGVVNVPSVVTVLVFVKTLARIKRFPAVSGVAFP